MRQCDKKGAPFIKGAFDPYISAKSVGNCLCQAEAKSNSGPGPTHITPIEPIKHLRQIIL